MPPGPDRARCLHSGSSGATLRILSDTQSNLTGVPPPIWRVMNHTDLSRPPDPSSGTPSSPLSLLAYARISDLTGKRGTPAGVMGVDAQHAICDAIARGLGGAVAARYTDNDRPASRDEHRPGFEALLADLHRGRTSAGRPVDGVVTADDDRIYKTPAQWQRFLTAFRARPGRLFADERGAYDLYDDAAEEAGWHNTTITMGENRRRRDRTRRWHAAQAIRGAPHTGGRTFGYRPAPGRPGEIEVVPGEAAVIRAAVAACAEGRSWGAITALFQRSGLPTAGGGPWRTQTVKQIISSPRLAGLRILGGEIVTAPDGSMVFGRWEPIITVAEWEAVRSRHAPRDRLPGGRSRNPRPTPRKYLLSGFLRCGREHEGRVCNGVMAGCATKQGLSAYRYACRPKSDGGCGGTAVSGEWMDQRIGALVLATLALDGDRRRSRPEPCVWERQAELDALMARRETLEARWHGGEVGDDFFFRNAAALEGLIDGLGTERRAWRTRQEALTDGVEARQRRWSLEPDAGGYDLAQRRSLVALVLTTVLVFPVGKGTRRRGDDSYLPVLKMPLDAP
ncbi:recombinase family protein [Spirillospora sp. NPDC029432]|uniref:recombinase family protein n=1 Tax=Spirillospora sp. NPDC029432 TaxID=3154599 RepID=UPI003454D763